MLHQSSLTNISQSVSEWTIIVHWTLTKGRQWSDMGSIVVNLWNQVQLLKSKNIKQTRPNKQSKVRIYLLAKLFWIFFVVDHFHHILQIVLPENVSANCCCVCFFKFCKLSKQTTFFFLQISFPGRVFL